MDEGLRRRFEEILNELARNALLGRVDLGQELNVRAVLANDASVCGADNPVAFHQMRGLLMLHYVTRERALETLDAVEVQAIVYSVVEGIRERMERHGNGR